MDRKISNSKHRFVTLGPAGTNHEVVTVNYLSFHGLASATIELVDNFQTGLEMMNQGSADFMIQVAVHSDCANTVASAHFKYNIHIVDTFISPSKELGILTRAEVDKPRTVAIQPATSSLQRSIPNDSVLISTSALLMTLGLRSGSVESQMVIWLPGPQAR